MTLVPMKARSELVMFWKLGGGGVCDTSVRFQIASPASWRPGDSPTRGSGDGGTTSGFDMSGEPCCMGPSDVEPTCEECAHPASASDATSRGAATRQELVRSAPTRRG